jgi:hypothetical protein
MRSHVHFGVTRPPCGVLGRTAALGSFANSCGNTTPRECNDADATTARANAASYGENEEASVSLTHPAWSTSDECERVVLRPASFRHDVADDGLHSVSIGERISLQCRKFQHGKR